MIVISSICICSTVCKVRVVPKYVCASRERSTHWDMKIRKEKKKKRVTAPPHDTKTRTWKERIRKIII